jgi:hypothetical protein
MTVKAYRMMTLLLASLLLATLPAQAHHSFPAQYDIERQATVEGLVTKVEWRNPHVYFFMDAFEDDGSVVEWSFELSNISAMRNAGWSSDTLKAGDLLTVSGSLARDNSPLMNATSVIRTETEEKLL